MSGHVLLYVPKSIVHRWLTVLITCILVAGAALPVIWLLVEPYCVVTGAIHVAPSLTNILTGEPSGQISDYGQYMNTQAMRMTSGRILQDVADDLAPRGLSFFKAEEPSDLMGRIRRKLQVGQVGNNPVEILRTAIADEVISAGPIRRSEYIGITMKHANEREAKVIVDSFLQQFENSYGVQATKETNSTLTQLDDQERELAQKIRRQQNDLQQIARDHGTTAFDSRQEMAQQRQKTLAAELTRLETQRIHQEAKVAVLAQGGDSNVSEDELAAARKQYVSSDRVVEELAKNIVETKINLIVAEQNSTAGDPEVPRRKELLAAFEATLEKREMELAAEFDEQMRSRTRQRNKQRLASAKADLQQIQANEQRLRDVLDERESETRKVGIASADYQQLLFDMRIDQELYETILRRKKNLEMQLDRQGRVSIAYRAELESTVDSRAKFSGIVCLAGLFAGMVLAVARGPRKARR